MIIPSTFIDNNTDGSEESDRSEESDGSEESEESDGSEGSEESDGSEGSAEDILTLDDTVSLSKRYGGSITIYSHQVVDIGDWDWEGAKDWDVCGGSSGGGIERRFPDELQMTGPGKHIKEEFENIIKYLSDLNKRGVGRYDIHANVYINDYSDLVFTKRVTIDDNRELDSEVFSVPYDPNSKMHNYNFKD